MTTHAHGKKNAPKKPGKSDGDIEFSIDWSKAGQICNDIPLSVHSIEIFVIRWMIKLTSVKQDTIFNSFTRGIFSCT
jgi:hypothetical protein